MKKVRSSDQLKIKLGNQASRSITADTGRIYRAQKVMTNKESVVNKPKTINSNLGSCNLDFMKLS